MLDVFQLRNDMLGTLRNPKIKGKQATIERLVVEIGAQLIEYCYSEVFSLPDLVRITAESAEKAGMPDALRRTIELWECGHLPDVAALLEPPKKKRKAKAPHTLDEVADDAPEQPDIWQIDNNGKIRPNERNALKALEIMGVQVSYDRFAMETRIEGLDGYGPCLDEDAHNEIYLAIPRECYFKMPAEDLKKIVRSAARRNSFDPVTDYLDGLVWDGVDRIDEWLITYGGARDDIYTREVGSKMLMAAVRRARDPGCKFDYMPIFEGPERVGKSTVVKVLAGASHFTDSVPIHSSNPRDTMESMRGIWIAEYGELVGLQKAEVEAIKAWMSRSVDSGALKYDRESSRIPRRFIVVGTTNPQPNGFLSSTTGNRRFWPVVVTGFDLEAVTRDRDQLWAEAAYWEAKGGTLELSPKASAIAFAEQQEREVQDIWGQVIRNWARDPGCAGYKPSTGRVEGELHEIAFMALDIPRGRLTKAEQMRVAEALRKAGFVKVKRADCVIWRRE